MEGVGNHAVLDSDNAHRTGAAALALGGFKIDRSVVQHVSGPRVLPGGDALDLDVGVEGEVGDFDG